jgi:putative exporter of polyketide antibiotics
MIRKILSIITGYLIFAITSIALFWVTGQDPHARASFAFEIITAIYGIFFSFLAGLVVQLISRTQTLTLNYILAIIIVCFAVFSLLASGEDHWTQILSIVIFAPVSVIGGMFYNKRNKDKSKSLYT